MNNETKHTPGPWIVAEDEPTSVVAPGLETWVADCDKLNGQSQEESEANAKLIAAAPDLLEALLIAKKCLKENRGPSMDEFKKIQTAITKAIA